MWRSPEPPNASSSWSIIGPLGSRCQDPFRHLVRIRTTRTTLLAAGRRSRGYLIRAAKAEGRCRSRSTTSAPGGGWLRRWLGGRAGRCRGRYCTPADPERAGAPVMAAVPGEDGLSASEAALIARWDADMAALARERQQVRVADVESRHSVARCR